MHHNQIGVNLESTKVPGALLFPAPSGAGLSLEDKKTGTLNGR